MLRVTVFMVAMATSASAWAAEVPASIGEDVTWSLADSPYRISEDVTVAEGVTLTIEPGVRVELAMGRSLTIAGQLIARGTADAAIVFTRSGDEPDGRWRSIVFADSAVDARFEAIDQYVDGSIVEHCIFEHGERALRLTGASPYVVRSTFRHNQTPIGPDLTGGAAILIEAGATPRIRGCTFTENVAQLVAYGGAVYATQSDPILQDNVFKQNASVYGGALATDLMASPIVGNTFEENEANSTKGGAASLISTISAFLNNQVVNNRSVNDGGGLHICVDCYPHATPFFMDNTIAHNTSVNADLSEGAAGFGAAYLRMFRDNNVHDNLGGDVPSDFGWYHHQREGYPDWVANRSIAYNWWGQTNTDFIERAVFDGADDPEYHRVDYLPVLDGPVMTPTPRVTITTRKLRYVDAGDEMPVFLTLYNPGPARKVELSIMLQYGDEPPIPYGGPLSIAGVQGGHGSFTFTLPENAVHFSTLLRPSYAPNQRAAHGFWHAALFDQATGDQIGVTCSVRFDLVTEEDGS